MGDGVIRGSRRVSNIKSTQNTCRVSVSMDVLVLLVLLGGRFVTFRYGGGLWVVVICVSS